MHGMTYSAVQEKDLFRKKSNLSHKNMLNDEQKLLFNATKYLKGESYSQLSTLQCGPMVRLISIID